MCDCEITKNKNPKEARKKVFIIFAAYNISLKTDNMRTANPTAKISAVLFFFLIDLITTVNAYKEEKTMNSW